MDVIKNNEDIIKKVRVSNYRLFFNVDTEDDYQLLQDKLI